MARDIRVAPCPRLKDQVKNTLLRREVKPVNRETEAEEIANQIRAVHEKKIISFENTKRQTEDSKKE